MTVLTIDSKIKKWEQSNNKIKGILTEGDRPLFTLLNHHPTHKSLMKVENNIYCTNIDTDFILDIDIVSMIQFDIDGLRPTPIDLYEAYLKVKDNEDEVIWEKLKERFILIARPTTRRSFNHLETVLEEVIQVTYNDN